MHRIGNVGRVHWFVKYAPVLLLVTGCASPNAGDIPNPATDPTAETAVSVATALTTSSSVGTIPPATSVAPLSCPTYESVNRGTLPSALTELSGWALSKRHPQVLWGHNDAGDGARLIGVSAIDGSLVADVTVTDAPSSDWEDVATFTDENARHWIVVADTGDNAQRRAGVQLVLIPDPRLSETSVGAAGVVNVTWAEGPHDVESLIIDPVTGDATLLGKRFADAPEVAVHTVEAASLTPGASVVVEQVGTFAVPSGQTFGPTAGSINAAGTKIGLLFYDALTMVWERTKEKSVAETILQDAPCSIESGTGKFESLAIAEDGVLLQAPEGRGVPLTALSPAG